MTVTVRLCVTDLNTCYNFWLAGSRVEPSTLSPFVWKIPSAQGCGCDIISAMRFSNWGSYQPDNAGDKTGVKEACLAMENSNSQSQEWYDLYCGERICAICEYQEED